MPLYDQDGNQVEKAVLRLEGVVICRVEVEHDRVLLFEASDDTPAFVVSRPDHPGAGLALDVADGVVRKWDEYGWRSG